MGEGGGTGSNFWPSIWRFKLLVVIENTGLFIIFMFNKVECFLVVRGQHDSFLFWSDRDICICISPSVGDSVLKAIFSWLAYLYLGWLLIYPL